MVSAERGTTLMGLLWGNPGEVDLLDIGKCKDFGLKGKRRICSGYLFGACQKLLE